MEFRPSPELEPTEKQVEAIVRDFQVNFIEERMPFLDSQESFEGKSGAEMLSILRRYYNQPASFENYQKFLDKFGEVESGDENKSAAGNYKYLSYLINKIPHAAKKRWLGELGSAPKDPDEKLEWDELDETDYIDLLKEMSKEDAAAHVEKLIRMATSEGLAIYLGFNTSQLKIPYTGETQGNEKSAMIMEALSIDVIGGGGEEVAGSKSWYSIKQNELSAARGTPKYVYLVEGTHSDINSDRLFDKGHGAVMSRGRIPIMWRIPMVSEKGQPISGEIVDEFDLGFTTAI